MTFTYGGALATDKEKVRFYIGDTTENAGPKPSGGNFTDEEIDALVTLEGNWKKTVAACFEALEALWSDKVDFSADGVSASDSDAAKRFGELAVKWRRDAGGGVNTATGFAATTKIDGYSYDVDNEDVDEDDAFASADYLLD